MFQEYDIIVERLCDRDAEILLQLQRKRPSTGIITLALAIDRQKYQRYILSGFSFELTHPYAPNPVIEKRGTAASPHGETSDADRVAEAVLECARIRFAGERTVESLVSLAARHRVRCLVVPELPDDIDRIDGLVEIGSFLRGEAAPPRTRGPA